MAAYASDRISGFRVKIVQEIGKKILDYDLQVEELRKFKNFQYSDVSISRVDAWRSTTF